MNDWIEKVNRLDLSLFNAISSLTRDGCRKSLLAVQRATARLHNDYSYLEIGSYLGGTIQPHLVDDRCKRIYSIDLRPSQTPDDRLPGLLKSYDDNSTERMLYLLGNIGYGDIEKIECFELDASKVDPARIASNPQMIFIDGEHTKSAVLSDFQFCSKVISEQGTILFHDFGLIYPAIFEICNMLDKQHHTYLAMYLEGSVFAIFFDPDLVHTDPYLASLHRKKWPRIFGFLVRKWLRRYLPSPLLKLVRKVKNVFRKKTVEL